MTEKRRILVIGGEGFNDDAADYRIESFRWENLIRIANISEYDNIIVHLEGLAGVIQTSKLRWDELERVLFGERLEDTHSARRAIVLLGDPRIEKPRVPGDAPRFFGVGKFLDWTGIDFHWDNQPGSTVRLLNNKPEFQPYSRYLARLRQWSYSLKCCAPLIPPFAGEDERTWIGPNGHTLGYDVEITSLAANKSGYALAAIVSRKVVDLTVQDTITRRPSWRGSLGDGTVMRLASFCLLPPIPVTVEDAIQIVLEDVCGVESRATAPDWSTHMTVPGQEAIRATIEKTAMTVDDLNRAKQGLEADLVLKRKPLKILYAGQKELEELVRWMLGELGAQVEPPREGNKEEGWVEIDVAGETLAGVLEVKSTSSPNFDEYGRLQLLDWKDRGKKLRNKEYKGIFIGNHARAMPPDKRPFPFSANWKKSAETNEICAMTTLDLFKAYCANQDGCLEKGRFWAEVFCTSGIFDLDRCLSAKQP